MRNLNIYLVVFFSFSLFSCEKKKFFDLEQTCQLKVGEKLYYQCNSLIDSFEVIENSIYYETIYSKNEYQVQDVMLKQLPFTENSSTIQIHLTTLYEKDNVVTFLNYRFTLNVYYPKEFVLNNTTLYPVYDCYNQNVRYDSVYRFYPSLGLVVYHRDNVGTFKLVR